MMAVYGRTNNAFFRYNPRHDVHAHASYLRMYNDNAQTLPRPPSGFSGFLPPQRGCSTTAAPITPRRASVSLATSTLTTPPARCTMCVFYPSPTVKSGVVADGCGFPLMKKFLSCASLEAYYCMYLSPPLSEQRLYCIFRIQCGAGR